MGVLAAFRSVAGFVLHIQHELTRSKQRCFAGLVCITFCIFGPGSMTLWGTWGLVCGTCRHASPRDVGVHCCKQAGLLLRVPAVAVAFIHGRPSMGETLRPCAVDDYTPMCIAANDYTPMCIAAKQQQQRYGACARTDTALASLAWGLMPRLVHASPRCTISHACMHTYTHACTHALCAV